MSYVYLILAFSLNALANIMLKLGAKSGFDFSTLNPLKVLINNSYFIVGCFFFAINSVFYFLALKNLPLSVGYPIMVIMSFVLINLYALFILKETFTPYQVLGYGFLIIGLWLIVSNQN